MYPPYKNLGFPTSICRVPIKRKEAVNQKGLPVKRQSWRHPAASCGNVTGEIPEYFPVRQLVPTLVFNGIMG
ncbi:MAG: hypothetical protein C5B53_02140 [Candidatus Melainabacteria bacterium]|nr:MAG: hypothetical protein C5B53_02140 [Candidatus Melainabacteria bacterium]